jgi:crotonobetainyl-CoA:carnitine CoA-transferase CaiB-like acyl-CoA transferase
MGKGAGPLRGIRILDLTTLYPGPLATMMLGDLGADVVRIERHQSPDMIRFMPPFIGEESAAYLTLNRSKRTLVLDLKTEEGRSVFFDLVKTADIVTEQFRPGVLDKIGIGYEEARRSNPRIIYVSLTGFGQDGPYALRAGHDINYMSWAGLLSQIKTENRPVLPAFQIADVAGGCFMTVIACLSALWYREKSGQGQRVDVAMVDAILPLLTLQLAQYWGQSDGSPAVNLLTGAFPCYGLYECSDGKYISLGALEPKFWTNFCKLMNRGDWLSGNFASGEEGARVHAEVAAAIREKTRDEWVKIAESHDICLGPVNEIEELEEDPHLRSRGMIVDIMEKGDFRLKGLGIPIKFSESKPSAPDPVSPAGTDSVEILKEVGYSAGRVEDLIRKGVVGGEHKG